LTGEHQKQAKQAEPRLRPIDALRSTHRTGVSYRLAVLSTRQARACTGDSLVSRSLVPSQAAASRRASRERARDEHLSECAGSGPATTRPAVDTRPKWSGYCQRCARFRA
jgi:hypothetical protein